MSRGRVGSQIGKKRFFGKIFTYRRSILQGYRKAQVNTCDGISVDLNGKRIAKISFFPCFGINLKCKTLRFFRFSLRQCRGPGAGVRDMETLRDSRFKNWLCVRRSRRAVGLSVPYLVLEPHLTFSLMPVQKNIYSKPQINSKRELFSLAERGRVVLRLKFPNNSILYFPTQFQPNLHLTFRLYAVGRIL